MEKPVYLVFISPNNSREYVLGAGSFGTVYEGCVVPLEKANKNDVDMESDDKKVAIKVRNSAKRTKS